MSFAKFCFPRVRTLRFEMCLSRKTYLYIRRQNEKQTSGRLAREIIHTRSLIVRFFPFLMPIKKRDPFRARGIYSRCLFEICFVVFFFHRDADTCRGVETDCPRTTRGSYAHSCFDVICKSSCTNRLYIDGIDRW